MASDRRFRLLLGTWAAYWVVLTGVALGPMALAILRATGGPDNGKSSVNAAFGNGVFSMTVVDQGQTIYTSSVHFLTVALWIAGPPLLAWVAFAISGRRQREPERV